MFGIFKSDPVKKLEKLYQKKLEEGVNAQRNGDMSLFAKLSTEADNILKEIDEIKSKKE